MEITPIFQKQANLFVLKYHRHHKPVVGSIFQIGVMVNNELVGVAICGRPVARHINFKETIEVNRLCVKDGFGNVCSKLYASCSRIAKELGYKEIITYILESESGTSLKAAGWVNNGMAGGKKWNSSIKRMRTNKTITLFGTELKSPEMCKVKWSKQLNPHHTT